MSERFPIGPHFDPTKSSQEDYIDCLYELFRDNLISRPLYWKTDGLMVSFRRHPEVEGRHAVFWHIISGGNGDEASRQIEFQRCVRLQWIRTLIEIFNTDFPAEAKIRWWVDKKRTSKPRYVITRAEFDYIVVVEERQKYALLVTAYYAEQEHRRRKLRREHDKFWEKQEPPIG